MERIRQWMPLADGIHKQVLLWRGFEIKGLEGSFEAQPFYEGLYFMLGKPVVIILQKGDTQYPRVHHDGYGMNVPLYARVELVETDILTVRYLFIESDEIVTRETGTYVYGTPIKTEILHAGNM